jgi:hypothetical protein
MRLLPDLAVLILNAQRNALRLDIANDPITEMPVSICLVTSVVLLCISCDNYLKF